MKSIPPKVLANRPGFSLIEVVIAIGLCSFCMIAMLGLLPVGVKSVQTTTMQTSAASILKSISMDLRSTMTGSNVSPGLAIPLPTWNTPNASTQTNLYFDEGGGTYPSASSMNAKYTAVLTLSNASVFVTMAQIRIYWPAGAAATNAQGWIETVTSIARM